MDISFAGADSKIPWLTVRSVFVPIGVVTVILGPMLPELSSRWSLNYAQAGSLFTVQFAAATFGVALSGLMIRRAGYRLAITLGLAATGIGVCALTAQSWHIGIAGVS